MSTSEDTPDVEGAPEDAGNAGVLIEVDASESPAARIAELEAQVATLTQEKKDLWEKFVRGTADLENFRKRTKRDLDDAKAESKGRVLKEMLPVVDNLERAIVHASADTAAVLDGVKLVLRQFNHAFEKVDVTAVEADGKPFDPNQHEAIGQAESDEPPGTVITVLQKGYRLGDRLLRPAMVVVAKPKAAPAEPETAAPPEEAPPPPTEEG